MIIKTRVIVCSLGLALAGFGCMPPVCDPVPASPQSVCHRADAGAITPDASFVLEGLTFVQNGSCQVSIDGGQIDLQVSGGTCGSSGGNAIRAAQDTVRCTIPPLAAGTYTVTSNVPTTFSVPASADAGVTPCP